MKTPVLDDAVQSALETFGYWGIIRSGVLLIVVAIALFRLIRQGVINKLRPEYHVVRT